MKLTYKNYVAKENDGRFDLSYFSPVTAEKETKHHKKGDKYQTETTIGYGYTFETMIKRIVEHEISQGNETLECCDYIIKYRELTKQITNILNN